MIDNTKGEVKMVRGSGPPLLAIEGSEIKIADVLYVVSPNRWQPKLPSVVEVIGIDLTKRTIRLRTSVGQELIHDATSCPDSFGRRGTFYWLYTDAEHAKTAAIATVGEHVQWMAKEADKAIEAHAAAKKLLSAAEQWRPQP